MGFVILALGVLIGWRLAQREPVLTRQERMEQRSKRIVDEVMEQWRRNSQRAGYRPQRP